MHTLNKIRIWVGKKDITGDVPPLSFRHIIKTFPPTYTRKIILERKGIGEVNIEYVNYRLTLSMLRKIKNTYESKSISLLQSVSYYTTPRERELMVYSEVIINSFFKYRESRINKFKYLYKLTNDKKYFLKKNLWENKELGCINRYKVENLIESYYRHNCTNYDCKMSLGII